MQLYYVYLAVYIVLKNAACYDFSLPTAKIDSIRILQSLASLPDKNKEYQFYHFNQNGKLEKQWMSLQEVQKIIISYSLENEITQRELGSKRWNQLRRHLSAAEDRIGGRSPPAKKIRKSSVEDVLDKVQKVMSKQIANALLKDEQPQRRTKLNESTVNPPENSFADKVLEMLIAEQTKPYFSKDDITKNTVTENILQASYSVTPTTTSDLSHYNNDEAFQSNIKAFSHQISNSGLQEENFLVEETTKINEFTTDDSQSISKEKYNEILFSLVKPIETNMKNTIVEDTLTKPSNDSLEKQDLNQFLDYIERNTSDSISISNEQINNETQKQDSVISISKPNKYPNEINTTKGLFKQSYLSGKNAISSIASTKGSNVLKPLEIAKVPKKDMEHLEHLQGNDDFAEYEFDDTPIYLEDLSQPDYSDQKNTNKTAANLESNINFDFPSPESTNSYHKPDHVPSDPEFGEVDPSQFLPVQNPAWANSENPLDKAPEGNVGLLSTIEYSDQNIRKYVDKMNDLAFEVYKRAIKVHRRQNLVMSPLSLISSLSMLLLGSRGHTANVLSEAMNMDDYHTFNPHLFLKIIKNEFINLTNVDNEAALAIIMLLEKTADSDHSNGYFSQTLRTFYNSSLVEVETPDMGAVARDLANEIVRDQTKGSVNSFLKSDATLKVNGPLSIVSGAYFQGKWTESLNKENLFDMNFIRFPSAERRLIRTVGLEKKVTINAGYSEEIDATIAEIPIESKRGEVSLLVIMPGQQRKFVANGLAQLETNMNSSRWNKLLTSVSPHNLTFKMPIFSHRNYLNLSSILSQIGLKDLFEGSPDLSGINGAKNINVGDVVQLMEFHSCKLDMQMFQRNKNPKPFDGDRNNRGGDGNGINKIRISDSVLGDKEEKSSGPLSRSKRNSNKVLAYDRAFFYVLRHNPSGINLFIGRYLDPETF